MLEGLFLVTLLVARKHVLGVVSKLGRVPPSSEKKRRICSLVNPFQTNDYIK